MVSKLDSRDTCCTRTSRAITIQAEEYAEKYYTALSEYCTCSAYERYEQATAAANGDQPDDLEEPVDADIGQD